jgi:hypothetical protein
MHPSMNAFVLLADRTEAGDSFAQGELRRKLEPEMVRIVRRVVQHGAGRSSMDRRILAEADRVGLDAEAAAGADGELLIRKVARCVSALFVDGLRSRGLERDRVGETICS